PLPLPTPRLSQRPVPRRRWWPPTRLPLQNPVPIQPQVARRTARFSGQDWNSASRRSSLLRPRIRVSSIETWYDAKIIEPDLSARRLIVAEPGLSLYRHYKQGIARLVRRSRELKGHRPPIVGPLSNRI